MNAVRSRDVAGFIIGYWWRSRRLVAGAFATMVAVTACDIFLPVLAGTLIDSLVDVSAERRPAQLHDAVMALAAVVGITAGYHLLRETSYRFWIPLATLTMRRIACDAFERVQRFSADRSEEHTSELQSLMRISYAVFCLKKKQLNTQQTRLKQ